MFEGDYIKNQNKKYKKSDTVIVDGQGWYHYGMLCPRGCTGCPYLVEDVNGCAACYMDEYLRCKEEA